MHAGDTRTVIYKFDLPALTNIFIIYQTPTLYYIMNRTTTNYAPTTPDDHLEDDNHYFIPVRVKVCVVVQFCDCMGIQYFKENIFHIFNVGSYER